MAVTGRSPPLTADAVPARAGPCPADGALAAGMDGFVLERRLDRAAGMVAGLSEPELKQTLDTNAPLMTTAALSAADRPHVSVILPAYNRDTLVARAIDSVLAQTWSDFELIIVDDASTDGTRAVLERYRDHPKVRLILSDVNRGGSGARNLGIDAARAPLIAFQDSDDVWLPHKLAAQVAALAADPAAGLCYCGALFSQGSSTYYIPEPVFARLEGDMSRETLRRTTTSTQTLLVRREVLAAAGLFDAGLKRFQDWDLMIRVAQLAPFVFLPEPMVIIFATPGNISSVVVNDAISRAHILEKYAELFRQAPEHGARNHYITGRVWQRLGQQARARPHFQKTLALKPDLRAAVQFLRSLLP